MRRGFVRLTLLAAALPLAGLAGGDAVSRRFVSGAVAVTNSQANSSLSTVAVLIRFDEAATGTASVKRESQGSTFTLAACTYANATNLVWVADRDYRFEPGDVLRVEVTAGDGVVQVMRKGE